MNAISVAQPFAELIVRGVKRWERRPWETDYRGPLAIHASNAVPSNSLISNARRDEELWPAFWAQGWRDRDDIMCLPRSAVIGVVDLVRVVPAAKLTRLPPLIDEAADGDFLWEFANAVWIDGVGPLAGKQKLWALDERVASEVALRRKESEDRRRREGGPAPGQPIVLRDESYDDSYLDEPPYVSPDDYKPPTGRDLQFANKPFARLVERVFEQYYHNHQTRGVREAPEIHIDTRLPLLATLFPDREWVPRLDFEAVVREHLWIHGNAALWQGRGPAPNEDDDHYDDGEDVDTRYGKELQLDINGEVLEPVSPDDRPKRRSPRKKPKGEGREGTGT